MGHEIRASDTELASLRLEMVRQESSGLCQSISSVCQSITNPVTYICRGLLCRLLVLSNAKNVAFDCLDLVDCPLSQNSLSNLSFDVQKLFINFSDDSSGL